MGLDAFKPAIAVPLLAGALALTPACVTKKQMQAAIEAALAEQDKGPIAADTPVPTNVDNSGGPVVEVERGQNVVPVPYFERESMVSYGEPIPAEALHNLYGVRPGGVLTGDELRRDSGQALLLEENDLALKDRRPEVYAIYQTNQMAATAGLGTRALDGHNLLDPSELPSEGDATFAWVAMIPSGWTQHTNDVDGKVWNAEVASWCLDDADGSILEEDHQWRPSSVQHVESGNPKWRSWIECPQDSDGELTVAIGFRLVQEDGERAKQWMEIGRRTFGVPVDSSTVSPTASEEDDGKYDGPHYDAW